MGATNSTLNYQLSQFISTDKPAWLQDYNGDMEKIDVGINTAKVAADTAQNTANSAVSSIGTVSSDITALQTDVLAHTNDITDLQGDVNTIESLIGNGTPTTTDHTIIGAINEINSKVGDLIKEPDFNGTPITTLNAELSVKYYTATQDCYINGLLQGTSAGGGAINLVNNDNTFKARIAGGGTGGDISFAINVFIKAGWKISYSSATASTLTVYPVV